MNFYRLNEVPISRDDAVFRESTTINAVATVIFYTLAAGAFYLGITKWQPSEGHMAPYAPYFIGAVLALFGLIPLGLFRASLKPSNWLMRCQLSGFVVKYRGYENWKLPANTLQAVGFDYGEIAWAKLVKERRTQPSSDPKCSSETVWLTFIDLGLAKSDTAELEANLQAERNLRPDGRMIVMDYPVQVQPGGIVEIRWGGGIRPSAKKALAVLGQRVKILEPEHRVTDLTHRRGANPEAEKANILALAKSGDEMGAVKLAQQIYGYSLTDATNYVDKLLGKD